TRRSRVACVATPAPPAIQVPARVAPRAVAEKINASCCPAGRSHRSRRSRASCVRGPAPVEARQRCRALRAVRRPWQAAVLVEQIKIDELLRRGRRGREDGGTQTLRVRPATNQLLTYGDERAS